MSIWAESDTYMDNGHALYWIRNRWHQMSNVFIFPILQKKETIFGFMECLFLLAFFFVWRFWRENENDCNKRLRFGDTFSPASQSRGFKPLLVACLPRSAWRWRQAGRTAGDSSLRCLLQLLPYDPHGQRSWPARTDHWPETLSTMCDFYNFGLIFTGQCTVCLKG